MIRVDVADFSPEKLARLPDRKGSIHVRDMRKTDLERVRRADFEEMKRQVLRDRGLTPDQAIVELESFDSEGKPVFVLRAK